MHRYMAVCVVFYASCYIYKEMKKMISNEMAVMIEGSSAIRAMFEEGAKLAEKYGKENVYDFSLGNPNVPAPAMINDAIKEVLDEDDTLLVHGYMMNAGYEDAGQHRQPVFCPAPLHRGRGHSEGRPQNFRVSCGFRGGPVDRARMLPD